MTIFLQATFEGLSLGSVYSLVAIGLVLVYKATDVLSFAHPALVVVGAGLISALAVDRGVPFWLAFIIGIIATGLIGLIVERTFLRPMVGEPVFSVAILTIGIDILLRTILNNWIGLNPRYLGDPFPSFGNFGSLELNGVTLKYLELAALFTAIIMISLLTVFFKKSKYGVAMMATSYDQEAALAQGINVGRMVKISPSSYFVKLSADPQRLRFVSVISGSKFNSRKELPLGMAPLHNNKKWLNLKGFNKLY